MAGRFENPFPQFFNSTPTALSGAQLFFYAAGSSTKQSTYSNRSLSSANTNPVVLNSAGRPSVEIWLQDLDYKVVLAPSTDTDPPTSPIWTSDYVRARDSALIAKTLTGSGSPSGVVAGTAGSASILPDFYWDYTNAILYVCTTTGTSSTAVWTAVNASTAAAVVPPPQGYLTLTTQTPFLTGDVSAATSVYYTPLVGNIVPIYNGSSLIPTVFTELTLTLVSSHAANKIYDVFVFNNSGIPTLVTGPSWDAGSGGSVTAGSCARGTGAGGAALARVNGIYTNAVQITGRNSSTTYTIGANLATYLGSIFMDTSNGQVTCHRSYGQSRKWGLWNAYNRAPVFLKAGDSTASWTYTNATIRAANGSSANSATIFSGLAEDVYHMTSQGSWSISGAAGGTALTASTGLGFNSTTVYTGFKSTFRTGITGIVSDFFASSFGQFTTAPLLGINVVTLLENSQATDSTVFSGAEANNLLTCQWRA